MLTRLLLPIAVGLSLGACTKHDPVIQQVSQDEVHRLVETNHTQTNVFSTYKYGNNRVDTVTHTYIGNNLVSTYMTVTYLEAASQEIATVHYNPWYTQGERKDTLIYNSDLLVKIIKTEKENGTVIGGDTTYFSYDDQLNLIEARKTGRKVEFLDYMEGNPQRVKHYHYDQLHFDISLTYDNKKSPFIGIRDLRLVYFNDNDLHGIEYLSKNNITGWSEIEYQPVVITNDYQVSYTYDSLDRPILSVMTRVGSGSVTEEYYKYK